MLKELNVMLNSRLEEKQILLTNVVMTSTTENDITCPLCGVPSAQQVAVTVQPSMLTTTQPKL